MTPDNCQIEDIAEIMRTQRRFVVISHARPDGDALGCTLAMALCLKQLGRDVTAWNDDGMPEKLRFLPHSELVTKPPAEPQSFEVALVLDNAVKSRGGRSIEAVAPGARWINIDHHVTNERYGDLNYVDATAPATGQILYELISQCELPMTYAIADNLFAAISTDTGSFQYPSTTARTYEIGAALLKAGVNVGKLSQHLYESYPRRRLELLREMLNVMQFTSGDRVASISLTRETVQRLGTQSEDTEGLIDHVRAVQGVIVAAFFEELEDGRIRASLRSKSAAVDVSKICGQFGGGGHKLAAGARLRGPLAEARQLVLAAIDAELAAAA